MNRTSSPSPARRIFEFFISTKKGIPADRITNTMFLLIALFVTVAPLFITSETPRSENLKCAGIPLPGQCLSRTMFNTPCPGCGMTHAFMHIAQGQPRESMRWNRAGFLLYVYFVFQVFLRAALLLNPARARSVLLTNIQHYAALGMIGLLLLNWVAGIWLGGNGS